MLASATLLVALASGCGEETTAPDDDTDRTIEFPGEVADLQAAVEQAAPGDTVLVAPGSHVIGSRVRVTSAKADVTILGAKDTAHGGDGRPVLVFTLSSNNDAITIEAEGVRIEGLEITGAYSSGVVVRESDAVITDCVIRGAIRYGVSCATDESDALVERNVIVDAGLFGVHCVGGAPPLVQRNTIVGAGDCGIYSFGATPTCRRNIVADSANLGIACFGPGFPTIDCNCLFGSGNGDYSQECTPGKSDVLADPRFCDMTSFTLFVDSPCTAANAGACGAIGAVDEVCALAVASR